MEWSVLQIRASLGTACHSGYVVGQLDKLRRFSTNQNCVEDGSYIYSLVVMARAKWPDIRRQGAHNILVQLTMWYFTSSPKPPERKFCFSFLVQLAMLDGKGKGDIKFVGKLERVLLINVILQPLHKYINFQPKIPLPWKWLLKGGQDTSYVRKTSCIPSNPPESPHCQHDPLELVLDRLIGKTQVLRT